MRSGWLVYPLGACLGLLVAACSDDGPNQAPITGSGTGSGSGSGSTVTGGTETDDSGGDGDGDGMPTWTSPEMLLNVEGSASLCDIDGDGTLELVQSASSEADGVQVAAFEVSDGTELWRSNVGDGGFVPVCRDVNGDGRLDLLLGGRGRDVVAISGLDGSRLWRLSDAGLPTNANTYTVAEPSPGDPVLFVTAGGGGLTGSSDRFPGRVVAFDGSPRILATWLEPDSREIYTSPAVAPGSDGSYDVAVGTGGETLTGPTYWLSYDPASTSFRVVTSLPTACDDSGHLSSPLFLDLPSQERLLVESDHCGRTFALRRDGSLAWSVDFSGERPWPSMNPTAGDLDGDGNVELVVAGTNFNASLAPPDTSLSDLLLLDAATGAEVWSVPLEGLAVASPTLADYDGDGTADLWQTVLNGPGTAMYVFDGATGAELARVPGTSHIGSQEFWDVDGDGQVEAFLVELNNGASTVSRVDTQAPGPVLQTGFRGHLDYSGYRSFP